MNFFDQQSIRRRQSALLLVGFFLAMGVTAAFIHIAVGAVAVLFGHSNLLFEPSSPALALTGLVWTTILLGAFFRTLDVKAGGAILARRFGAVHASDRSRFELEQQLLNVVEEMSIASSTPQPEVYILRKESSINAFVLGAAQTAGKSERYAIVVTQGALESFNRDELQAVVAHEFGHISNGDLPINMRLLIALSGLMAIDEVGKILVGKHPDELLHPGVIVGYFLIALGSVGVFLGKLIRSAFSRQREYLADSSAVQFTRNPYAIASALSVIKQHQNEPALHGVHANELAHVCFQSGGIKNIYQRLLSSHPCLQKRIDAIDPHFDVKSRKVDRSIDYQGESGVLSGNRSSVTSDVQPVQNLSDGVTILLSDARNSIAVLFALFVCNDVNKQSDFYNAAAFAFDKKFSARIKEVRRILKGDLDTKKLALIELATQTICTCVEPSERHSLFEKLESLLSVGDDYGLTAYASLQLIRSKLDIDVLLINTLTDDPTANGRNAKAFDEMGSEFALLLSLMIESSGSSPAEQEKEFERVLKCYTNTQHPRRTSRETGIVSEVVAAFQILHMQPMAIREAFVQHCVEIVQKDGHVARAEKTLLDLFAASLGCQYAA
ncbi:MAG: M48 family metalloprotease [Granulosicoccus sp.]